MNITVKVVNTISSNKLYHKQFRQTLVKTESQYGDYEFRWLSRIVYELRNEFTSFLNKYINITAVQDAEWS